MRVEDLSKMISVAVVPAVIISACALLSLALANRLAVIVSRLRAFHRERLSQQDELDKLLDEHDEGAAARRQALIDVLETQVLHIGKRARLVRLALVCLLGAVGFLILCSASLALSVVVPAAAYAALLLFFCAWPSCSAPLSSPGGKCGPPLSPLNSKGIRCNN